MIGPLWDAPPPLVQAAPQPSALSARQVEAPFDKFLKVRIFELLTASGPQTVRIVNGPGHDCAAVAAIVLDPQSQPYMVMKTGDARVCRVMRGDSYLKLGCVAGRLDKEGASAAKIGLAELTEEVGGEVVANSFRPLGEWLSPTMPGESSEADADFFSLIRLNSSAQGDGGGMEVAGLIGPVFLSFQEGFAAMESGTVGDAGRAMALYRRCADSIGYVPELAGWVYDHPGLMERYHTLGLGQPVDPRPGALSARVPDDFVPHGAAAEIEGAAWISRQDVALPEGFMVDGQTVHTAHGKAVGAAFANQLLILEYDRAKVVDYFEDEKRGPLVRFAASPRPAMAVKGLLLRGEQRRGGKENLELFRLDVEDVKIRRDRPLEEQLAGPLHELGQPCGASSGQSDLYYHFCARRHSVAGADWIPLGQALELCRTGQGDGQTEAALIRLARQLKWLPNLGMNVEQARALLK
ncbi:hypothetical protein IV102_05675 [bacterium]|nr:hypothetical protein [bacterium]